jgi:hypothetical protein
LLLLLMLMMMMMVLLLLLLLLLLMLMMMMVLLLMLLMLLLLLLLLLVPHEAQHARVVIRAQPSGYAVAALPDRRAARDGARIGARHGAALPDSCPLSHPVDGCVEGERPVRPRRRKALEQLPEVLRGALLPGQRAPVCHPCRMGTQRLRLALGGAKRMG